MSGIVVVQYFVFLGLVNYKDYVILNLIYVFYQKFVICYDLGLVDVYIDGDFEYVDLLQSGFFKFFLIMIVN